MTLQFRTERNAMKELLALIDKFAVRRANIPILTNVLLQGGPAGLTATVTDLDIKAVATTSEIVVTAPGETTVPYDLLKQSVNRMPDGAEIEFGVQPDGQSAILKCGRARARMHVMQAQDFPDMAPSDISGWEFSIPSVDLARMAADCLFAVSTEETRYYLQGVYLHPVKGALNAVACDGKTLSVTALSLPKGAGKMPGIIVPTKTVRAFGAVIAMSGGSIDIRASDSLFQMNTPRLSITSKLIDGTYPDYERVIPNYGADSVLPHGTAKIGAKAFSAALDRLNVYSQSGPRASCVEAVFSAAEPLALHSAGESGEIDDAIEVEGDLALRIGFNGNFMREILSTLQGDAVVITASDPSSPILVNDCGDDRRRMVLMPMALDRQQSAPADNPAPAAH